MHVAARWRGVRAHAKSSEERRCVCMQRGALHVSRPLKRDSLWADVAYSSDPGPLSSDLGPLQQPARASGQGQEDASTEALEAGEGGAAKGNERQTRTRGEYRQWYYFSDTTVKPVPVLVPRPLPSRSLTRHLPSRSLTRHRTVSSLCLLAPMTLAVPAMPAFAGSVHASLSFQRYPLFRTKCANVCREKVLKSEAYILFYRRS